MKKLMLVLTLVLALVSYACIGFAAEALACPADTIVRDEASGLVLHLIGFDSVPGAIPDTFTTLPATAASHFTVVNTGDWTWDALKACLAAGMPQGSSVYITSQYAPAQTASDSSSLSTAETTAVGGIITFSDGATWEGATDRTGQLAQGFGTMTTAKATYIGQYANGLRSGFGKMLRSDGTLYCVATWLKGDQQGYGAILLADGTYAEGLFEHGLLTMGTMTYPTGESYTGCFDDAADADFGTRLGYGEITMPSGRIQKLYWEKDGTSVKINPRNEEQARSMIRFAYFITGNRAVTSADMDSWLTTRGKAWQKLSDITSNLDEWAAAHQVAGFDEASVRSELLSGYTTAFGFVPCELQIKAHVKQIQIGLTTVEEILLGLQKGGTLAD